MSSTHKNSEREYPLALDISLLQIPFKPAAREARINAAAIIIVKRNDQGFATLNANMAINIDIRCIEYRARERLSCPELSMRAASRPDKERPLTISKPLGLIAPMKDPTIGVDANNAAMTSEARCLLGQNSTISVIKDMPNPQAKNLIRYAPANPDMTREG